MSWYYGASTASLLLRLGAAAAFAGLLLVPAFWLAGRIEGREVKPFFRLLVSAGLALIGYVTIVNLVGRPTRSSFAGVFAALLVGAVSGVLLWRRKRDEFPLGPLLAGWRAWLGPLLLAVVLAVPQWFLGASTNYWDETACSAIHITGVNQFSEGVFPPRHNALPDVSTKYHYGFMILSGTARLVLGLPANVGIDVVSTALWLFAFLFIFFWLRDLEFGPAVASWGGFAVLFGGGLSWLFIRRIEAYRTGAYEKTPALTELSHGYDATKSWLANVVAAADAPSQHLRNGDGSLSNLPWDIAAQYQQHTVALGIAATVFAFYLFARWQGRGGGSALLTALNIVAFGVLFLCHAVYGGVAAVTAGTCLVLSWLRRRTMAAFLQGIWFTAGVGAVAFLHGGMLARGAEYGTGGLMALRKVWGYADGGFAGFVDWNVAGFGLPLLLSVLAWGAFLLRRGRDVAPGRRGLLEALTVFSLFSYMVPHLAYYVTEGNAVEQYTEISKFFFCAHMGFALLSVFGAEVLMRHAPAWALVAGIGVMAVSPAAFCYAASFDPKGAWKGFYGSPYEPYRAPARQLEQLAGEALLRLKKGNHETYFDASADERVHGFLSELLIYGGSVFTMTPSRFERNGVSFRIAERVVARRLLENGRVARLLPGSPEEAGCRWFYARPEEDVSRAPLIVRSRFAKLLAEGCFVKRWGGGARALYAIEKPTRDLDRELERYWRPRVVAQARGRGLRGGPRELMFYDLAARKILIAGGETIALPVQARDEFVHLWVDSFPGDGRVDFLLGRMEDTDYHLGKSYAEVVEVSSWAWSYRESAAGQWDPEYRRWYWDGDIPLLADLDGDGFAHHIAYRRKTNEWLVAPAGKLISGPAAGPGVVALPVAGRFLKGSRSDLGLWSLKDGMLTLRSVAGGEPVSFRFGSPGDVFVPGDYDGDGYDEVAVWNPNNLTWYWRKGPAGPQMQATFGSEGAVPVPFDYNNDGKLDLAYWEPQGGRIVVSLTQGRTVDMVIPVPPHSIPAFVNWY